MNEGGLSDYRDLQRLIFTLNQHFQSKTFQIFGRGRVSRAFVDNLRNGFEEFVLQYTEPPASGQPHRRKSAGTA